MESDDFLRKFNKPILEPFEMISQKISEPKLNEEGKEADTFTIPSTKNNKKEKTVSEDATKKKKKLKAE